MHVHQPCPYLPLARVPRACVPPDAEVRIVLRAVGCGKRVADVQSWVGRRGGGQSFSSSSLAPQSTLHNVTISPHVGMVSMSPKVVCHVLFSFSILWGTSPVCVWSSFFLHPLLACFRRRCVRLPPASPCVGGFFLLLLPWVMLLERVPGLRASPQFLGDWGAFRSNPCPPSDPTP